jgi:phosphatidylserine/phosphatidylglycerophosphate/cardiolipin synthase-like enzyme
LNEHVVVGDEWKASRSWRDEQRRRPSGHELAVPIRSPQQRWSTVANSRGNARPTLEAQRTDGARKSLFYSGFHMLPVIKLELEKIERSICGFQYQLDHSECIAQMILKIAIYGVQGRLILDKVNFYSSSCTRQSAGVNELYKAGCLFRIRKPSQGNFSCMHVKCLILDEKVVLTGSVNLTHNGLENNKEHVYR